MTTTVFIANSTGSYHRDRGCPALDTALMHTPTGKPDTITTEQAADRRPCIVCTDTVPTSWTVTAGSFAELYELIGPSKPHTSSNEATGLLEVDGLTILEHDGLPRTVARFGDTISFGNGRYTVAAGTSR